METTQTIKLLSWSVSFLDLPSSMATSNQYMCLPLHFYFILFFTFSLTLNSQLLIHKSAPEPFHLFTCFSGIQFPDFCPETCFQKISDLNSQLISNLCIQFVCRLFTALKRSCFRISYRDYFYLVLNGLSPECVC